jgi:hypothetical protein
MAEVDEKAKEFAQAQIDKLAAAQKKAEKPKAKKRGK